MLNETTTPDLAEHIAHQTRLARADRRMARWDRSMGIWMAGVPLSTSPGFVRAATAMKIARSWKMEAKTGLPHCICHLRPSANCPSNSNNRVYWKRGA